MCAHGFACLCGHTRAQKGVCRFSGKPERKYEPGISAHLHLLSSGEQTQLRQACPGKAGALYQIIRHSVHPQSSPSLTGGLVIVWARARKP